MTFTLPSRLIGTLTAAAIALGTFGAAPAFADSDRNARVIATILGLAVVGKIIHDNKKKKDEVVAQRYDKAPRQGFSSAPRHGYDNRRVQPKPLPRRVDNRLLPGNCLRSFQTRHGQVQMFGQRCLQQNYRFVNQLPRNCAQTIRTDRGNRAGYDARCLSQKGYRLARR
jgi:hypothetical protein